MELQSGPQRTRRVTRACDRCHSTNTKCASGPEPTICQTCFEFRSACTYNRPVKRRGPKVLSESFSTNTIVPPNPAYALPISSTGLRSLSNEWVYSPLVDADHISALVHGYHSIVYPIFPLFHWPSFTFQVKDQRYINDRAFYVTVMAVCSIVVARQGNNPQSPAYTNNAPTSQAFYQAAAAAFPPDLHSAQGFEYKRAKVLMAIACIQYGSILEHKTHLGEYVVLACNDGFHDESRWEIGLTEVQRQERRRMFWSAYTLEVFSAITWDGVVRLRERQSNVAYPAEVYDEDITEFGWNNLVPSDPSFFHGWNFTTDMYRILEHLVGRLKNRKREPDTISAMFSTPGPPSNEILEHLTKRYQALPPVYRSADVMTGDIRHDCFGFQAANIAITFQTVKLALAGAEHHSVGRSCEIAGELLDALAAIPTAYIMSISAPMLHHLASCGQLLASIIQTPLSPWALMQVRNVLTAMIDLLSGLERSLSLVSDVSIKLRGHVAQIETYMEQATRTAQQGQVFHSVIPRFATTSATTLRSSPTEATLLNNPASTTASDLLAGDITSWTDDFTFEWPSDHQIELQSDLTENWPFDLGAGIYDFLGQASTDQGQGSSNGV